MEVNQRVGAVPQYRVIEWVWVVQNQKWKHQNVWNRPKDKNDATGRI